MYEWVHDRHKNIFDYQRLARCAHEQEHILSGISSEIGDSIWYTKLEICHSTSWSH